MGLKQMWAQAQGNPVQAFRFVRTRALHRTLGLYNAVLRPQNTSITPSGNTELDQVRIHSLRRCEISDHLVTLFTEAMAVKPHLIVELGVEKGESTFVFERVAHLCGSQLVSVDLNDCSDACSYPGWLFVQSDDISFASNFVPFCHRHGFPPFIDVLFIDTSHEFAHTTLEIERWFPFLADNCVVFFHDTNVRQIYSRRDGSLGVGYDNRRGVIAALEACLGKTFDEKRDFVDVANNWLVRHYSSCSGLTILKKQNPSAPR